MTSTLVPRPILDVAAGQPSQGDECILIGVCAQPFLHVAHMKDVVVDPNRIEAQLFCKCAEPDQIMWIPNANVVWYDKSKAHGPRLPVKIEAVILFALITGYDCRSRFTTTASRTCQLATN